MLSFFKGKKDSVRILNGPEQLGVGDIVVLKERLSLPPELQGQQLEVTGVGTYQYASSVEKELTLRTADSVTYHMSVDDNDGDPMLCFSKKLSRKKVLQVFDQDEFALLWEPEFANLDVQLTPDDLASWLTDGYHQIIKDEEAYYYNRDCGDKPPSQRVDDDGEELLYHECEGDPDSNYSLTVEVYGDGETEVMLCLSVPIDVIDELWPHGGE